MTGIMIDTTHAGLPAALPRIRSLAPGNAVALYDTGSPDIAATPADLATIPTDLKLVMIDQGFTGSPNLHATVRDCEKGAWQLANAVNRNGWSVPRPTLYLGFPDTAQQAFNAGWRGDVWLVNPANAAPTVPAPVPAGLNVVAEQWDFSDPDFDVSVIFDPTWPGARMTNVTVPNCVGLKAGDAHNSLVNAHLVPTAPAGQRAIEIVTSTVPPAGTSVAEGTRVEILTHVFETLKFGPVTLHADLLITEP